MSKFRVVGVKGPDPDLLKQKEEAENLLSEVSFLKKVYGPKWKSQYKKNNGGKPAPTAAQLKAAESKSWLDVSKNFVIELEEV